MAGKGVHDPAVGGEVVFFGRFAAAFQVQEFGAVQSDAVGAAAACSARFPREIRYCPRGECGRRPWFAEGCCRSDFSRSETVFNRACESR